MALSADTPATQLVPAGPVAAAANIAMTKVTFAGSGKVSKVIVTRGGVSTDASLTGVKLFDGNVQIGTTQTFNAIHQAVFTLTTPWTVSGTGTLTIAGDYALGQSGQVILSIQNATDITADVTVSGTFPIVGNPTTGSPLTNVGSLTVDNGSLQPVGGGTVDVDATNFIFMQAKLTAGAAEDVYINAITVARGQNSTIVSTDVTNITLYNDTAAVELGKVTSLDSKITFSLATPILLERGRFVEISVRADILGGSGRNIAFDVNDGVAYTILATGKSYGYGVALAAGNFAGIGPATGINQGILNISRGTNCPATGNVSIGGSDIKLGSFNFKVRGEEIRIGSIIVSLNNTTAGGAATNPVNALSLVKLVDSAGNVAAGPVTPVVLATGAGVETARATFTSSVTLSPGDNELYVVANIANNVALANESYQVGFSGAIGGTPGGGVAITNVRGLTSNLAIVPTPAANVLGNGMTARQGALTADMTATPVVGNVIIGGQKAILANLKLDATASGEDVRITSITATHRAAGCGGGGCEALTNLSDIELWDGSTQVGLTTQPPAAGATVTFTLTTPYVVSKGTSKILALKANLIAGTATWEHQFQINAIGNIVCTTTSGAPVGVATTAAWSPAQTLQAQGDLRVTVDASPVTSAQLVAGTSDNEIVRYKFWAYDENVDVSQVWVWVGNTVGNGAQGANAAQNIASVSLWVGGVQISGSVPVSANAASLIGLAAGSLTVPKDGTKVVSLKVSFNDKTSLASGADYQFGIADSGLAGACTANDIIMNDGCWGVGAAAFTTYGIVATGSSSGAVIPSVDDTRGGVGQIFGGNTMEVFDGKLVVSLNGSSPSGTATPGQNKEVMRIDLEAIGDDILVTNLTITANTAGGAWDNAPDSVYLQNTAGTATYECSALATDSFDNGAIVFPATQVTGPCLNGGAGVWENALLIAEGTTVTIKVVGDTTGGVTNQTLQLSVIDSVFPGVDIAWTDVSGGTPSTVGTQVIPLYGNTLRY